jgi:regulation of enolase protein 1 (concanavalin A-like superfamily)
MCKKSVYLTCLGLVLGLILTNAVHAQDPNLLGWWKLDEPSGTIAYDSSGNFNDGVLVGDPQWSSGYAGGAVWLDGVDDFIEVPHNDSLLPGEEVTVMCWINTPRLSGAGNSNWQALVTKGNAPRVYSFYTDLAANALHFSLGPEGAFLGSNSSDPIPLNEWVHVCAMLKNGSHLYYINGEPSAPLNNAGAGSVIASGNTATVRIGNAPENNSFLGKIDDVRVYNGALSQEQIKLIMVSGLSPKATRPNPDNSAPEVPRDTVFSWKEGQFAVTRNVYFGTNFDDVNEAIESDPRGVLVADRLNDTTFDPLGADLLEYNTVYYWRVDEINDLDPNSPWKGDVWSFTTVNFIVVDNFEDYNDYEPHRLFDNNWKDGFGTTTNGATVGYLTPDFDAGEHFVETAIVRSGKQSMPYFYDNGNKFSEAVRKLSGAASNWTRDDVVSLSLWFKGYPAYVGGFEEAPAGTYMVKAVGSDIFGNADEFHFAYREVTSGACSIIAKVESLDNTDPFAKAGIMIRNTLEPDSVNVALLITPENGIRYQRRPTADNATERDIAENITAPYWLRIERTAGGLLRAYYSMDGVTWASFGLKTVTMQMPIYVGLAVCSHNTFATCQATFSNVSFPSTNVNTQWNHQDIGIISNSPESMYVVLNNSAVVYHEDPNASLIRDWTQWTVPLQEFADKGVNLTNINSLGIGFGDRNNPQAGGTGTMFFDDIRLYRPETAEQP